MVDIRLLPVDEWPDAITHWVDVFGEERPFFQSLVDGGEADDFSVAAIDEGRIVSSVHVFMRRFRDREGQPRKVGGIGSVSTHPEYRSRGLSGKLLGLAIEGMAERACEWSYLGTGVNRHYARYGWRSVSTPRLVGLFEPAGAAPSLEAEPVTDELLEEMAAIHARESALQPMANARTATHWRHAVRYRVTGPIDRVFPRRDGDELVAYLVARQHRDALAFIEGFGAGVADIVAAAIGDATKVVAYTAPESEVTRAVKALASRSWPEEDTGCMARPIADRISWSELAAILYDPRGRRSELDHF